jgi:HEXXH motif-containing protein
MPWSRCATFVQRQFARDGLQVSLAPEVELAALLNEWLPSNEAHLAATAAHVAKQWVTLQDSPELSRHLFEPLVLAWLGRLDPDFDLAALLLPVLHPSSRPLNLRLVSDPQGVIELPGIGELLCNTPGQKLLLHTLAGSTAHLAAPNGSVTERDVQVRPLPIIPGTRALLARCVHPLLTTFYDSTSAVVISNPGAYVSRLEAAFQLIHRALPNTYPHLQRLLRRVTLHEANTANSFASPGALGMISLETPDDVTEVGFAEDIVHQGGHVLCTIMTLRLSNFFAGDPMTPGHQATGIALDTRSIYEVFHGLFTGGLMIAGLGRLLSTDSLSQHQMHETLGRLALISARSAPDLFALSRADLLTDAGLRVMLFVRDALAAAVDRHGYALAHLDLSGQPYAFSYQEFLSRNPITC